MTTRPDLLDRSIPLTEAQEGYWHMQVSDPGNPILNTGLYLELLGGLNGRAMMQAIRRTIVDTPGVLGLHDLRTRKMGDMIVVDVHIEVDAAQTVEAGHNIAVQARERVMQRHRVINLLTHVDPAQRPDLDHLPVR